MNCAFCPHHKCYTSGQNCTRLAHEEISEYYTDEDKKMMRASSATESRNYLKMTRLEESVFFAKEMGVKKVGIAFCIGLPMKLIFVPSILRMKGWMFNRYAAKSVPSIKICWNWKKSNPDSVKLCAILKFRPPAE